MIHTAFIPPVVIDNSKRLDNIDQRLGQIGSILVNLTSMEARLKNIETSCKIIEQRQEEILDIITILNKRIVTTMERVFDLEHAK